MTRKDFIEWLIESDYRMVENGEILPNFLMFEKKHIFVKIYNFGRIEITYNSPCNCYTFVVNVNELEKEEDKIKICSYTDYVFGGARNNMKAKYLN